MHGLLPLSALPPYGVFETTLTHMRGLVLRWYRTRDGRRNEAVVLLLGLGFTLKKRVRAALRVVVHEVHRAINSSYRPTFIAEEAPSPQVWGRSARQVGVPVHRGRRLDTPHAYSYSAAFA